MATKKMKETSAWTLGAVEVREGSDAVILAVNGIATSLTEDEWQELMDLRYAVRFAPKPDETATPVE